MCCEKIPSIGESVFNSASRETEIFLVSSRSRLALRSANKNCETRPRLKKVSTRSLEVSKISHRINNLYKHFFFQIETSFKMKIF